MHVPTAATPLLAILLVAIGTSRALAQPDSTTTTGAGESGYDNVSLDATSRAPWIPASAVPDARPWEAALRSPGRVLSLPLFLLGRGLEYTLVYVEDHDVEERVMYVLARSQKLGLTVRPASLGDRAGFGAELLWAPPPLDHHLEAAVSGTLQKYNRARVSAATGPARLTWQDDWRPGERFFGVGPDATEAGESNYAVKVQSVRASLAFGARDGEWAPSKPREVLADDVAFERPRVRDQIAVFAGPREARVTRGRSASSPSFDALHPGDAGAIGQRIEHFTYGLFVARDTRQGRPHYASGWRASVEAERRDRSLEAFAIHDAHSGARSFTRMTYRFETNHSFGRDPRTLRLNLEAIDQSFDAGGGITTIDDLAVLGGSRLAGFRPGRFHDRDAALAKLTYIYPLVKNVEFDLHTEAGAVFPSFGSMRVGDLEQSYGFAFRFRGDAVMFGSAGMDFSRETARLRFSFGGVE